MSLKYASKEVLGPRHIPVPEQPSNVYLAGMRSAHPKKTIEDVMVVMLSLFEIGSGRIRRWGACTIEFEADEVTKEEIAEQLKRHIVVGKATVFRPAAGTKNHFGKRQPS